MIEAPFLFETGAASDTGRVRNHNEDSFLTQPESGVWLVADGMGGHQAGDFASRTIAESVASVGRPASAPDLQARFLDRVARARGWGLAVAGASVRYRRRVKMFDRIEMRTRLLGWDQRFVYMGQSMWVRGECTSQALLRSAIIQGKRGIVPPAEMAAALGLPEESPDLPGWVRAWIEADAQRPWPPEG